MNLGWLRRRAARIAAGGLLVVVALTGCAQAEPAGPDQGASRPPAAATPTFGYRVVASHPHDPGAFTQGLAYVNGTLYEATGSAGVGPSSLRRVDLATGAVQARHDLAGEDFGEGIAVVGDRIIQLTWQSQTGFVYDRATLRPLGTFRYPGEGWGLAYDGRRLIMSDGTDRLRFLDPTTFVEVGSVLVRDAGRPVDQLNELEYIDGQVYANVWQTDRIVRIDPATGQVTAVIDLAGLLPAADRESGQVDVLNGIAYDAAGDRLFVTGKLWPKLYEIELVE
ncbi:MAG TPA: glutaminyl-peptide cyclotransferase [Actinomycetes bacterium]|nr:glutaminyl-peptide cyclotransferase [Actinomycetes bacterium]